MVNIDLLENEIKDMGIKRIVLAQKCGISRQTLEKKMAHPELFTLTEVGRLANALRIPVGSDLFASIFFAPDVEKSVNREAEVMG